MFARRGPGLVRAAATTAVVAGTAGAVRHRQEQKYAAQDQAAYEQQMASQAAYEQQMAAQQAAAAPAAPAQPDYMTELEKLAQLKAQGIISEEEFEAKKKQLLGI
jgi:Short C-terminal domain